MRMKKKIQEAIFSLSGASMSIAVLGFLSGIVTLFFDVNSSVSIKWVFFAILLSVSLMLILLKVIYDLSQESALLSLFETPIKYVENEGIFVIRKNENFINTIIVGCYVEQDEIERLAYLGSVYLVQDRVIQIKIRHDFRILDAIPQAKSALEKIIVKSVVPIAALPQLINQENSDG